MVPAPSCPSTWDYWQASPADCVELTCLLPNSVYIPLRVTWDATLHDIKEELWENAANYPLFGMLHESTGYVFQFVNSLAVLEVIDDEGKRLRDVKPVCGVLMIIERSVDKPGETLLNTQISHLIGKGLSDFDGLRSMEVNDFRAQMRNLAEESLIKRMQSSWLERLKYQCPPRLADQSVPTALRSKLNRNTFTLTTRFANSEDSQSRSVPVTRTPQQHIEKVMHPQVLAHNYVLKVIGREEYLFGEHPLIQFQYVQDMLAKDCVPEVMPVNLNQLRFLDTPSYYIREHPRRSTNEHHNTMRRRKNESSWDIDKNYACIVQTVGGLNVDPGREVICQAGIFHGGKPLCEVQKTRAAVVTCEGDAKWEQDLRFPIKVNNIPRMARLCFGIYEIETKNIKNKKKGKDSTKDMINKLAWANIMIFDYKDQLRTDKVTLFMSTHVADETQGDDQILHPLGTVFSNCGTESGAVLQVRFSNYECQYPILFPKSDEVKVYAENIENGSPDVMARLHRDFEKLRATAEKDPMYEMHEQDKKNIWALRNHFRTAAPQLLPRLLSCVEWGERAEAASAARMLADWPRALPVESALELLDYAFADTAVRSFAVSCLENISDDDLLLYLLQLVQALKHESYLMCDLSVFLLRRAFKNMVIGHYLFWHLRSEMNMQSVAVRFGLLLEAYCRGCQEHINILLKQITCLDKLKWVSQNVRKMKEIGKAKKYLQEQLQQQHCVDILKDFVSPLNPSYVCKKVRPEVCRVMDSKMRPLMVNFENVDPYGSDIRIILKIGDDLRQDMFTLQMLRIMDRLWKSHGYDFRLSPYNCISMENEVGMIEVVEDAETIANIQKNYALFNAASTIKRASLLQWLKRHAEEAQEHQNEAFNKAVDEFTMSCAGYCVATYVLGIADRHPDNIMLKKSGQLFHIDFGHFLGHFKYKYGIKRERVPFVLTHDFIHVINKGQRGTGDNEPIEFKIFREHCETTPELPPCSQNFTTTSIKHKRVPFALTHDFIHVINKSQRGTGDNEPIKFKIFREHCETAFKILRKHGHLILSLFSMMISTGLQELSSEKDLQYLRETLVMDLSEEQAMAHFRSKFNEAIKNSWTTMFNWAIHNIDKNN